MKQTEQKHTPTPMLPITFASYEHAGNIEAFLTAGGLNISSFSAPIDADYADTVRDVAATHQLICRAVRSHAQLVAALEKIRDHDGKFRYCYDEWSKANAFDECQSIATIALGILSAATKEDNK